MPRFLYSFARQRLRIVLRGDTRRRRREEKYSQRPVTVGRTGDPSPSETLAAGELADDVRGRIAPTPADRAALDAWLSGVCDPAELAETLGYPPGDAGRQQAVAVLAKLRQRLHRERKRHSPAE